MSDQPSVDLDAIRARLEGQPKRITGQDYVDATNDVAALLAEVDRLTRALAEAQRERDDLRTRAIVAEQHKALSLFGRGSYAEVVEDKLRTQLAEEQLAREQAEADAARARAALEQYGQHHGDCPRAWVRGDHDPFPDRPCRCGLEAALTGQARQTPGAQP